MVQLQGICGGQPIIKDSRLSVQHIAQLYKAGDTVDEILQAHPHVKAAAVYDALSYYLDHQAEIEQEIADNRFQTLQARYGLEIDERGFVSFTTDASTT